MTKKRKGIECLHTATDQFYDSEVSLANSSLPIDFAVECTARDQPVDVGFGADRPGCRSSNSRWITSGLDASACHIPSSVAVAAPGTGDCGASSAAPISAKHAFFDGCCVRQFG